MKCLLCSMIVLCCSGSCLMGENLGMRKEIDRFAVEALACKGIHLGLWIKLFKGEAMTDIEWQAYVRRIARLEDYTASVEKAEPEMWAKLLSLLFRELAHEKVDMIVGFSVSAASSPQLTCLWTNQRWSLEENFAADALQGGGMYLHFDGDLLWNGSSETEWQRYVELLATFLDTHNAFDEHAQPKKTLEECAFLFDVVADTLEEGKMKLAGGFALHGSGWRPQIA